MTTVVPVDRSRVFDILHRFNLGQILASFLKVKGNLPVHRCIEFSYRVHDASLMDAFRHLLLAHEQGLITIDSIQEILSTENLDPASFIERSMKLLSEAQYIPPEI